MKNLLFSYKIFYVLKLLLQGHDTTTAAVTWALFLIGSYPNVQVGYYKRLY